MATKTLAIWSPRPDAKAIEAISPDISLYGLPVIAILPKKIETAQLDSLSAGDGVIFTSQHAVTHFFAQVSVQAVSSKTLITIGTRTAEALQHRGLTPDLIASPPFNSEALLADGRFEQLSCQHFSIICGVGGRNQLQKTLRARKKQVNSIRCYQRDKINLSQQVMIEFITGHGIGGIILTSAEIADAVSERLKQQELIHFSDFPVFALSERIGEHARRLGFCNVMVAAQANQHFLYQCIINWWEGRLQ